MARSLFPFAYLHDARLAAMASAPTPALLWRADGSGIVWANGAAAALAGTSSAEALAAKPLEPDNPTASQIAGLADTLPATGSPRLTVLQSADGQSDRALTALCSRFTTADGMPAILAVGTTPLTPALSLAERVRLLLGESDIPIAAFTPDGSLLHANKAAAGRLDRDATLASLDAASLGATALATGHAEHATSVGIERVDRIGRDATTVLLFALPEEMAPTAAVPVLDTAAAPEFASPEAAEPAPEPEIIPTPPAAMEEAPAEQVATFHSHENERQAERRNPYRFVWVMDEDGHFSITSPDFIELIGPESSALLGRRWIDIATNLKLDPSEQVSRASDSRETWSGISVHWPVDGTAQRLAVELSGLPTFDRDRTYRGYRGFGVYRDIERLLAPPQSDEAETVPEPPPPQAETVEAAPPPSAVQPEVKAPSLSPGERTAFRELARQLSARLKGGPPDNMTGEVIDAHVPPLALTEPESQSKPEPASDHGEPAFAEPAAAPIDDGCRAILDRLPTGVLVYRINTPLYANRAFLTWSGDASLEAFASGGGLDRLFLESGIVAAGEDGKNVTLTADTKRGPAESRLFSVLWEGERAHALTVTPAGADQRKEKIALRQARARVRELRAALNLAADGVVTLDPAGNILRLNSPAEALFDVDAKSVVGKPFVELLAPENHALALADFQALAGDGAARHQGHEVMTRGHEHGDSLARGHDHSESIALFMTIGRYDEEGTPRYCAVFRDISLWKGTVRELLSAKRQAEQASKAKSDFIAKISHEIRTPLNAIIGFSEVMMEERLGPVENERYRAYLKDIHASGEHLVALLNDLLDLSKIEAGKLDLKFDTINLNELTQETVSLMQPQANRGRVIIRTSLAPALPPVVADMRSVRQILLNLMSNSIKFTGVGGQVIVSTTLTDNGEAVLRVRDTGVGMSETEIETALEPFRQLETSARGNAGGTGLGLPLTKALAEANRAQFAIKSSVNSGTLVEVAFPTSPSPSQ